MSQRSNNGLLELAWPDLAAAGDGQQHKLHVAVFSLGHIHDDHPLAE